MEVLQTSALPLGYGAGRKVNSPAGLGSASLTAEKSNCLSPVVAKMVAVKTQYGTHFTGQALGLQLGRFCDRDGGNAIRRHYHQGASPHGSQRSAHDPENRASVGEGRRFVTFSPTA